MVAITLSARAIPGNDTMHFGRVERDKETKDKVTNIEYLNTYNVQAMYKFGGYTNGNMVTR